MCPVIIKSHRTFYFDFWWITDELYASDVQKLQDLYSKKRTSSNNLIISPKMIFFFFYIERPSNSVHLSLLIKKYSCQSSFVLKEEWLKSSGLFFQFLKKKLLPLSLKLIEFIDLLSGQQINKPPYPNQIR